MAIIIDRLSDYPNKLEAFLFPTPPHPVFKYWDGEEEYISTFIPTNYTHECNDYELNLKNTILSIISDYGRPASTSTSTMDHGPWAMSDGHGPFFTITFTILH